MQRRRRKQRVDGNILDIQTTQFRMPEFNVPDIGLVGDESEVDIQDYKDLFDTEGTDDNTDTRYMRPRCCRLPFDCVRYDNAEQLATDLKITSGQRIDIFVSGNFIFGDFIEAFLRVNNCKAVNMTIATLSMNQENVDSLYLLMHKGFLDNLKLMLSDYFYSHERRTIIPYLYKTLDIDNRFQLAVAGIHTKTCHFTTLGGKKICIHGSANLRSNGNIEQMTIEEDPELYQFYEDTYGILFDRYKTINHSVRHKESWEQMEKRLMHEYNNR